MVSGDHQRNTELGDQVLTSPAMQTHHFMYMQRVILYLVVSMGMADRHRLFTATSNPNTHSLHSSDKKSIVVCVCV